jgi:hypothetical protein
MYSEAMHARKKDWSVQDDGLGFSINEIITCVAMSDLHIPEFFNHMRTVDAEGMLRAVAFRYSTFQQHGDLRLPAVTGPLQCDSAFYFPFSEKSLRYRSNATQHSIFLFPGKSLRYGRIIFVEGEDYF